MDVAGREMVVPARTDWLNCDRLLPYDDFGRPPAGPTLLVKLAFDVFREEVAEGVRDGIVEDVLEGFRLCCNFCD